MDNSRSIWRCKNCGRLYLYENDITFRWWECIDCDKTLKHIGRTTEGTLLIWDEE